MATTIRTVVVERMTAVDPQGRATFCIRLGEAPPQLVRGTAEGLVDALGRVGFLISYESHVEEQRP